MQNRKNSEIALFVLGCMAVNFGGKVLNDMVHAPLWLDSIGTIMAAYAMGPVCGAMVGACNNFMYGIFVPKAMPYALVNIMIGVVTGLVATKGGFKSLFSTFSVGMFLAFLSSLFSFPLNLFLYHGMTGNLWGDGVISFLMECGINFNLCFWIGEIYIEIVDKVFAVFVVYYLLVCYRKKKASKTIVNMVLLCLMISSFIGNQTPVFAGEKEEENLEQFVQVVYDENNGIPGGVVNAIEQTENGMIWIGTYNGLYQYDGNQFTPMSQFSSVRNVNCLYTDEEGRLWIGTNDGGVSICANGVIVNVLDDLGGLPSNSIRSIVKSTDGSYYIGTADALAVVELSDGIRIKNIIPETKYVRSLTAGKDGYVYAVTESGQLAVLKDSQCLYLYPSEKDISYTAVYADEKGFLFASTNQNHVEKYQNIDSTIVKTASYDCSVLNNICSIKKVPNGQIFLCADTGIGYLDKQYQFHKLNTNSFANSIENVIVDYQGNYWFASSRLGALKLSSSEFRSVFLAANLPAEMVNAVIPWNGDFYCGTDDGLVIVNEALTEQKQNELTDRLENVRVRNLICDAKNQLWIATTGQGVLNVSEDGQITEYNMNNGLIHNKTRMVLECNNQDLVVATDAGLSIFRNGTIIKNINSSDGLSTEKTLCLCEYQDTLYAGTDGGGIAVIRDGKVIRTIRRRDGLSSDIILRLTPSGDGRGIFVVTGNGLNYIYPNGAIRQLNQFPYNNIYDAILTGDGKVWITSSAGIYVVDEATLIQNMNLDYELLDHRQGLTEKLTVNSWNYLDDNHILYLCGDSGVVSIDTGNYHNNATSYRISLEKMSLDGVVTSIDKEEKNIIDRDVVRVEFYPNVINYSVNDPYVSVWLEGFDKEPFVLLQSEMESFSYTNLPSGDYIFHLAILDRNQENILEEVTYSFHKENEIYDNWWFILYMILIFIIVIVYLVWLVIGSQINKSLQLQKEQIENLKLKQNVDEAVAAGEAKDRFLALMSHEIRTPINAILGMNEMILRDSTEPEIVDYAMDIKSAGGKLLTLVNGILDFSKIEQGKMEIIPTEYDTVNLINELVLSVSERARAKQLDFSIQVDPDIPKTLWGDDVRIAQVILNLLTNAVKYTEHGYVKLSVTAKQKLEDKIILKVSVEDSGIGIREEDMAGLFESFRRLDLNKNRTIEGTGLGMSIVTNLLALMNSRLDVTSTYGVGSTFCFELEQKIVCAEPIGVYSVEHARTQEDEVKEFLKAPKASILVVDDNNMNLKVVSGLLRANEIHPDCVTSGREAIELVKEKHYDIIFMDHMMPELDGVETFHRMKEHHLLPEDTKVIILTANAINGVREQYLNEGFDDYMSKPIKVASLEQVLRTHLPKNLQESQVHPSSITKQEQEEPKKEESSFQGTPQQQHLLALCPEIDLELGLTYCMDSWDFYKDILQEYCKGNKIDILQQYYSQKDWKNYQILIHAVKGTSLSIGAKSISEEAKRLEMALKEENAALVEEEHPIFLPKYQDFVSRIEEFLQEA